MERSLFRGVPPYGLPYVLLTHFEFDHSNAHHNETVSGVWYQSSPPIANNLCVCLLNRYLEADIAADHLR